MSNTTVREAMTASPPPSISSEATVVEAARLLTSEDVGSLPVVEGDRLVGMVTDRVLHVLAKDLDPHKVPVADVCTHDPTVATPTEPLDAALQRMAEKQVRRLPVVDDGRLVRILAQADGPGVTGGGDGPDGRGDLRGGAVGGAEARATLATDVREPEGEPLLALAFLAPDLVDEAIEHVGEPPVGPAPGRERPHRHGHRRSVRVDDEGHVGPRARVEGAEHGELELVHALVG